jgi:hypothetical protein
LVLTAALGCRGDLLPRRTVAQRDGRARHNCTARIRNDAT